jgi:hypothetical protein
MFAGNNSFSGLTGQVGQTLPNRSQPLPQGGTCFIPGKFIYTFVIALLLALNIKR